jgi:hypothetical protein
MLRLAPNAITITLEDVEIFKQQLYGTEEKQPPAEEDKEELDPVFFGRAIKDTDKKRQLEERLGIEGRTPKRIRE